MYRTVIIDDENKSRKALCNLLKLLEAPVKIVGEAHSVQSALELIDREHPQWVFLDIDLQDGTGFDVLEGLHFYNFQLVFITAYDNYAIRAFRYAAVDYLTKPVDPDLLGQCLQRLKNQGHLNNLSDKLAALQINQQKTRKLALPDNQGIHLVSIDDILYCHSQNNYTEFHFRERKPLLVSRSLKEYEELLGPNGFFRAHQSYLIALQQVSQYIKRDGGYVVMSDGSQIPVARSKKQDLVNALV